MNIILKLIDERIYSSNELIHIFLIHTILSMCLFKESLRIKCLLQSVQLSIVSSARQWALIVRNENVLFITICVHSARNENKAYSCISHNEQNDRSLVLA